MHISPSRHILYHWNVNSHKKVEHLYNVLSTNRVLKALYKLSKKNSHPGHDHRHRNHYRRVHPQRHQSQRCSQSHWSIENQINHKLRKLKWNEVIFIKCCRNYLNWNFVAINWWKNAIVQKKYIVIPYNTAIRSVSQTFIILVNLLVLHR